MSGRTVTLVWLSVALSALTHGAAAAGDGGCLPDQACEGGLTVHYGSVNAECNRDMDKKVVASAPSLHIKGNSQTQVGGSAGVMVVVVVVVVVVSDGRYQDTFKALQLQQRGR